MTIKVYYFQDAIFIEQEADEPSQDFDDLIRIEPEQVEELIAAIRKAQFMLVSH